MAKSSPFGARFSANSLTSPNRELLERKQASHSQKQGIFIYFGHRPAVLQPRCSGILAMAAKAKEQRGVECLKRSQAARLARKCPRAFFPSLAASAMLSKNTGERSTGADLPAQ
jgi:hypothetical protein